MYMSYGTERVIKSLGVWEDDLSSPEKCAAGIPSRPLATCLRNRLETREWSRREKLDFYFSRKLLSLGIMEAKLRTPFKIINTILLSWSEGFQETVNWGPTMLKITSLTDSYIYQSALIKLYIHFLSHWMEYDRGDSFPFNFLNQMEFHLVQNRKENCHHDHIPFNVKGNGYIVLSVYRNFLMPPFQRVECIRMHFEY